jgi:hypothetical protein
VIDGNQRIVSLKRFLTNEFALTGLTTYPELDGSFYYQLDPRFQRHIANRTLRCIVIEKDTHPQIKFDVFERLNTGSVKLNAQELRHGIYHGSFMELVDKLTANKTFKSLVGVGRKDKRMKPEELIIRFFALYYNIDNYEKPLVAFLNDFCDKNKNISLDKADEMTKIFERTVINVHNLYGDLAFRIFDENFNPISKFNSALYDAEMLSVASHEAILGMALPARTKFFKELFSLFNNQDFLKTISLATSDKNPVQNRVKKLKELVKSQFDGLPKK